MPISKTITDVTPVTFNDGRRLHMPFGALRAGDIRAGQTIVIEPHTGRVLKIGRRKIKWPVKKKRKRGK
jgi:hypothetical protein